MSNDFLSSCAIYKTVATLPEVLAPNAIYLVRTGFGFDIYATDSQGLISHKHNGIAEKYFQDLAPTQVSRGKTLSLLIPYLFNTKNGNNWNTGFAKILDGVRRHKLLKFYPILDLLNTATLPEDNAIEAVNILNSYGATPLAYVKLASEPGTESVPKISDMRDQLEQLCDLHKNKIGVYLHVTNTGTIDKYTLSTISMEMSKRLMYPLVVYGENIHAVTEDMTNNTCGDIFVMHNNVVGTHDVLYNQYKQFPYSNKGVLIYGCSTGATAIHALNKYNEVSVIGMSAAASPETIHSSTLPQYFEEFLIQCTRYIVEFDHNLTNFMIGSVTYFANQNIPDGWLLCNGAPISRDIYSRLFAAIGTTYGEGDGVDTFNIPDLRGVFLRGLDQGRGLDPDREIGQLQSDGIRHHNHLVGTYHSTTDDTTDSVIETKSISRSHRYISTTWPRSSGNVAQHYTVQNRGNALDFGTYPAPETRPVNMAMYPCIKY